MARAVRAEYRSRCNRALHPPQDHGDTGVHAPGAGEARRAHADARGHQAPAEGDPAFRLRAHGGAGALLHLHRFHFQLCDRQSRREARLSAGRSAVRLIRLVLHHPDLRPPVRPDGTRRIYLFGAIVTGIFGFVSFGMRSSGCAAWIFVAIVLSLMPHDMMYGPQAAMIAEAFTPRLRYSGASLGYQLASIIAGGPAPLIATALFAAYHSGYAIAIYIALCAVVSLIAAALMPDY